MEAIFAAMTALVAVYSTWHTWGMARAASKLEKQLKEHNATSVDVDDFLLHVNTAEEGGAVEISQFVGASANTVAEAIRNLDAEDRKQVIAILSSPSNKARRAFLTDKVHAR